MGEVLHGRVDDSPPFTQQFLNRTPLDDPRLLSGDYWGELRIFLAVAKTGSFKRAAEVLSMSAPTVARQARRLQDVFHAQLFVSSTTGVSLTERGTRLAAHLAALDRSLLSLSTELQTEKRSVEGLVRVSITEGLAAIFLIPAIRHLSVDHPLIEVEIQNPLNLSDLRKNQTDMMLGFHPLAAQEITTRPLGFLHFIPVATQLYVDHYGVPTPSTLEKHLFLQSRLYQSEAPVWAGWNRLVATGRVAHNCESSFTYAMMVKAGLGIGLLGNYTMIEPRALPLESLGVHIPLQIFASVMTERLESKPVRIVFERICELFGTGNHWFAEELNVDWKPTIADEAMAIMFNQPRGDAD